MSDRIFEQYFSGICKRCGGPLGSCHCPRESGEWFDKAVAAQRTADLAADNKRLLARIEALIKVGDGLMDEMYHDHDTRQGRAGCDACKAVDAWEKAKGQR